MFVQLPRINRVALFAAGFCWVAAGALAEDVGRERLPPKLNLMRIEVQPERIELVHRYDYRQLLITGVTADGDRIDITRLAEIEASGELLDISPTRLIRPAADGQGELTISFRPKSSFQGRAIRVPVVVRGSDQTLKVSFVQHIMPLLSKQGCNAGTCHGAQQGKNGFKLSLRGYDPLFDHQALTDDLSGRRFNRAAPERSLMLLKPSGEVPHEGGAVLAAGTPAYALVRDWIGYGVELDLESPRVRQIELLPSNPTLPLPGMRQQMRVLAHYSDGAQRDVTAEAFVSSSLGEVIEADDAGLMTAIRRGEAAVLARYEGAYAATTVTVMGDRSGYQWQEVPENNYVDQLVYRKLQRVKILPSELASDAEFIRRVYLDLTGLPPQPDVVQAFLADPAPTQPKRDALVDRLIGSPEFVEHWTNKWADLLHVNRKLHGEKGAWSLRHWIRQAVATNLPYDQFVREIVTARGSTYENPAAGYYKALREPEVTVETTTQLFLGVRFNCNKCHDHPFERWTQDNYYHLASFFAQVGRKQGANSILNPPQSAAVSGAAPYDEEVIYDTGSGEVKHARTGVVMTPEFPYQPELAEEDAATRREQLAGWLTSPDNQYFAASYANRLWSYLLGRGIIDPVDDIRAGNPPTNPELLDRLTREFIESGFDTQALLRVICKSRVYGHSIRTNRFNEDDGINFSHAYARRLPAEVLIDSLHQVLEAPINYPGLPTSFRASQLPDPEIKAKGGFLELFGRPQRESPCECERDSGVMLGHALNLVNGPVVGDAIAAPNNRVAKLVAAHPENAAVVQGLYLAILCRPASAEEITTGVAAISAGESRLEGAQDLAWALVLSPAFLFNH